MNVTILRFDSINSTNTEAIEQAKRGAEEGLCVVARKQTAGRGRHGRTWVSDEDAGLFFSIVLRPKIETKFLPLITLMSSVVVFEVLKELYKLKPDIKWSNDVLVNEKKISGILAETTETENSLAVIVGIGINLTSKNFPAELSNTATSIKQETGKLPNIEELLKSILKFFKYFYDVLEIDGGSKKIIEEWAKRSSYFDGKKIRATTERETVLGTTCGLEENGALKMKLENGETKVIQAGDVERVRADHSYSSPSQ